MRAPLKDHVKLERVARQLVEDLQLGVSIKVSGGGGYLNTPRTSKIVSRAVRTLKRLGLKGSVIERAGASDSRYFSPEGVEAIYTAPMNMWRYGALKGQGPSI